MIFSCSLDNDKFYHQVHILSIVALEKLKALEVTPKAPVESIACSYQQKATLNVPPDCFVGTMKVGTDQALFPKSGESKGIQRPAYVKRLPPPADSRQQAQSRRHPSEKESRDASTSVFIVRSWDTDSNASPLNISFGLSESMQDEIPVNDRYGGCNFTGLCQSQVDVPVPTPEDESPGQGKDKTMRYEILACPPLPRIFADNPVCSDRAVKRHRALG